MIDQLAKAIAYSVVMLSIASCSVNQTNLNKNNANKNLRTDGFYEQKEGIRLFFYEEFDHSSYVFIEDSSQRYYPAGSYHFVYDKVLKGVTALCITKYFVDGGYHADCTPLNENLELPFTFISLPKKAKLTQSTVTAIRKRHQQL
jgi:hypothetical protein